MRSTDDCNNEDTAGNGIERRTFLTYDRRPDLMDVVSQIKVPIQGHYGPANPAVPVEDVSRFEQALRKQNTPVEFFYYEGANHAFCDYTRRSYNAEAATLAKRRMMEFLSDNSNKCK